MTLTGESNLAKLLGSGSFAGAYFLHGDAARLRDEAARQLVDAALDPSTRDFNLDRFHGDDAAPEELAAALAMPPMMADLRVVTVSEAQRLSTAARKVLLDAIERLPGDLMLLVSATIPKGSKAGFYRSLKTGCRCLEWSTPRPAAIPGWLLERAREQHGFELTREAAQAIAAAVGDDLSLLDAELAKLATAATGEPLSLERIRALVPSTRRIDRWAWLDLVAGRTYDRALRSLDDVLTSERGVPLVSGLVEHHVLLGIAVQGGIDLVRRALGETGRGYLAWKAKNYAAQARNWTADEIRAALRHLQRADRQLKSGGKDRAVLEELLLSLEQLRRRA
jgi:DNA polymerase-3 subunit delta